MTNIKKQLLKKLFLDDSKRFAGYWEIVESLLEKGECLTTESSIHIDFGDAKKFIVSIPYNKGSELVLLTLNKEAALESEVFTKILSEEKSTIKEDISNIVVQLEGLKKTLTFLENM